MKRCLILLIFIIISNFVNAQVKVPTNFFLVKGASPVGRDDYYTDGQYILSEDTPFQADQPTTDEAKMNLLTSKYGISFNKTRDGFYCGTGYYNKKFKYIVVAKGFSYILTSKLNNKGFSTYSKWLLNQIRFYIIEGDSRIYFKS